MTLLLLLLLSTTPSNQSEVKWQRYETRYLSLEVPESWKRDTTVQAGQARFDSPEGFFVATLFIGAHEKGRWKSLEEYFKANPGRYKNKIINDAVWGESRRTAEGSVEISLVALHNEEIVQVLIDYENEKSAQYAPLAKRIIESLTLPPDNK